MNQKKLDRRLDHKRRRQCEAQAIRGDHPRVAKSDRWNHRADQAPVLDTPSNGKKRGKSKGKAKQKCPVNGTHEWYREVIVEHGEWYRGKPGCWNCPDCGWRPGEGYYYCAKHLAVIPYTSSTKRATCIHCWTVNEDRPKTDPPRYWRYANLKLKKRPINLERGW